MEKKLPKIYLTYCKLLIAQGLGQAHYQILSIIFMKEFIKLNVNVDTMIKNVKLAGLNTIIVIVFLKTSIMEKTKKQSKGMQKIVTIKKVVKKKLSSNMKILKTSHKKSLLLATANCSLEIRFQKNQLKIDIENDHLMKTKIKKG